MFSKKATRMSEIVIQRAIMNVVESNKTNYNLEQCYTNMRRAQEYMMEVLKYSASRNNDVSYEAAHVWLTEAIHQIKVVENQIEFVEGLSWDEIKRTVIIAPSEDKKFSQWTFANEYIPQIQAMTNMELLESMRDSQISWNMQYRGWTSVEDEDMIDKVTRELDLLREWAYIKRISELSAANAAQSRLSVELYETANSEKEVK